ncbi:hypothetical protein D3C81_1161510 [compost metagenome]
MLSRSRIAPACRGRRLLLDLRLLHWSLLHLLSRSRVTPASGRRSLLLLRSGLLDLLRLLVAPASCGACVRIDVALNLLRLLNHLLHRLCLDLLRRLLVLLLDRRLLLDLLHWRRACQLHRGVAHGLGVGQASDALGLVLVVAVVDGHELVLFEVAHRLEQ